MAPLARFRMARVAVEIRRSGEDPGLRDPFGDRLVVTRADGVVRIESRGPTGASSAHYAMELAEPRHR